jgi:serine/threonine protein kinase
MATDPAKPAVTPPRRDVDREVVQAWLDALSTGACDEKEFLSGVEKLTQRSPEAGWDALALLDQYYRLGKIPAEVFSNLKSNLSSQLVGAAANSAAANSAAANGEELSVPLPQRAEADPPAARPQPAAPPAATITHAAPRPGVTAKPKQPSTPAVNPAPRTTQAALPAAPAVAAPPIAAPAVAPAAPAAPVAPVAPAAPAALAAVETLRRSARRDIAVGDVLRARYVIKSVLGRGGTGTVFEAADLYRVDLPESGQRVALKVLHGQIAGKPQLFSELQREFQLLQSLSHPNVVRAFDLDRDGDTAFLTMEFLRGLSLTGVLAARNQVRFERTHVLTIIRDVGGAVAHAHSRAVVHGDLNPSNIFITNEGDIRVLDFGAAHASLGGPTVSAPTARSPIATPRYASPQVLDGQRPDARDDVYSLACLAYVLFSGKHPFGERTALAAQEQRARPSRPDGLSGKEWRALRTALAFDRERRPADVSLWLEAFDWSTAALRLPPLLTLVRVAPPRRSRLGVVASVIAAIVGALAAALWANAYFGTDRSPPSTAARDSEPQQPDAPPAQSNAWPGQSNRPSAAGQVSSAAQPSATAQPSPAAQSTAVPPAEHAAAPPSAPTPQAAPTSSSAPPPGPASDRIRLAAGGRGAAASSPRAASSPPAPPASSNTGAAAGPQAASRVELAADTIDVPLTDPAARIIVRRRGSLQGAATFTWWTESGTAKPGQDFIAVAPHQEVIEEGKSSVSLFIPVVGDATRQQPKSFYVVINDPGPGVTLGARTLTMVTIPPSQ